MLIKGFSVGRLYSGNTFLVLSVSLLLKSLLNVLPRKDCTIKTTGVLFSEGVLRFFDLGP